MCHDRQRFECFLNWGKLLETVIFGLIIAWMTVAASGAEKTPSPSLERQFLDESARILQKLSDADVAKVGVLKFAVEEDGKPFSVAGAFPLRLAEQLEASLLIAMSKPQSPQLIVAHNSSTVADGLSGANHLTSDGRKVLFGAKYPVAWGKEKTGLDGFLTGLAEIAPNRKHIRVSVFLIHARRIPAQTLIHSFIVPTTEAILAEIGESFHLRSPGQFSSAEMALKSREDPRQNFPLQDRPGVKLAILYDNQPVNIEFRDEGAWIPEPREGQSVTMTLDRSDNSSDTLGAVLKVNGENTLYRERLPDAACHRWVLAPSCKPLIIKGFQMSGSNAIAHRFKVESKVRSAALLPDYGSDLGTISLTVFRELKEAAVLDTQAEAIDLQVVAKGFFPSEPARNLPHLLAQLRAASQESRTRGAIVSGDSLGQVITMKQYHWDPSPYFSVVIRYYLP